MPPSDDELLARLRATFGLEAQEHLQTMTSALLALEQAGAVPPVESLDVVFRAAHSLKGAARAVNAGGVESLCQAIEHVFSAMRRRALAAAAPLYDLLHRSLDVLANLLEALDAGPTPAQQQAVAEVRYELHAMLARPAQAPGSAIVTPPSGGAGPPSPFAIPAACDCR